MFDVQQLFIKTGTLIAVATCMLCMPIVNFNPIAPRGGGGGLLMPRFKIK